MSAGGDAGRFRRVDFERINRLALANAVAVVRGLLPGGTLEGQEYCVRNPHRPDRRQGSFKINTTTGRWGDFASGDKGGDLVSLAAFIARVPQRDAAIGLAKALGIDPWAA